MSSKTYHHRDLKNALTEAGIKILAKHGVSGLSLRKVAREAGVSHSAPYAHFADKQTLVAAISTEGFRSLQRQLTEAIDVHPSSSRQQMMAAGQAYARFALENRELFKLMFSGLLANQKDYPDLLEITQLLLSTLVDRIRIGQQRQIVPAGNPELLAISIWGQIHGIVVLALEDQIPSELLRRYSLERMALETIRHLLRR